MAGFAPISVVPRSWTSASARCVSKTWPRPARRGCLKRLSAAWWGAMDGGGTHPGRGQRPARRRRAGRRMGRGRGVRAGPV